MATEFETEAEVTLTVNQRSLREASQEIEDAIGDPTARLDLAATGGPSAATDGSGRYDRNFIGRRIDNISDGVDDLVDMADYRNRLLEDILDGVGGGGVSGDGGPLPRRRPGGGGGGGGLPFPIPIPLPFEFSNPFTNPNGQPSGQPDGQPERTPSPSPGNTPSPSPGGQPAPSGQPSPGGAPAPAPRTPSSPFGRRTPVPAPDPPSEITIPEDGDGFRLPEIIMPDVPPEAVAAGAGVATLAGSQLARTGAASAIGSAGSSGGTGFGFPAPSIAFGDVISDAPRVRDFINNPFDGDRNGNRTTSRQEPASLPRGGASPASGAPASGASQPLRVSVNVQNSVSVDPSRMQQLRQNLERELGPSIADDVVRRVEQRISGTR